MYLNGMGLRIHTLSAAGNVSGTSHSKLLNRGYARLDTGTHEFLHQASDFIQTLELWLSQVSSQRPMLLLG
jgi:dTDP-glucose pyrophosphorylase